MLFTVAWRVAKYLGYFSGQIYCQKLSKSPNLVILMFTFLAPIQSAAAQSVWKNGIKSLWKMSFFLFLRRVESSREESSSVRSDTSATSERKKTKTFFVRSYPEFEGKSIFNWILLILKCLSLMKYFCLVPIASFSYIAAIDLTVSQDSFTLAACRNNCHRGLGHRFEESDNIPIFWSHWLSQVAEDLPA